MSRAEVIPSLRPLVRDIGNGRYGWLEMGHGFVLDTRGFGTWGCVVGELVWRGPVLKPEQVAALVTAYGSPVLP